MPPDDDHLDWERGWERAGRRDEARFDPEVVASTGARLDEFAQGLTGPERVALVALLDAAQVDTPLRQLAETPASQMLTVNEMATFRKLRDAPPPAGVLRPSLHVVMKATRLCNLRCTYCNYWRDGPGQVMTFPVLARTLYGVLSDPNVRQAEFIWHGGEPTLLGTEFFRKALWLQQRFRRPGQVVRNRTQTNATQLSDEFVQFWRQFRFIVGVSLDGPPEIHDRRRVDRLGRPTAATVRRGLDRLVAAGHDPRVLLVVDDAAIDAGAERILSYLLELGLRRVGLLNVVPENTPRGATGPGAYLAWPRYVGFLRDLFDLWWPDHVSAINLREIADLARQLLGGPPQLCNFAGDCFGSIFTVEPDGEVAACDRYVTVEAKHFGSVAVTPFPELATGPRMHELVTANHAATRATARCRWFEVCHGGCPHDRDLSASLIPGWDNGCCGLAPLLDHMAERIPTSHQPTEETCPK